MKHAGLLVWLVQLGLSVAVPLAGFVLLAVWLRSRFGLGQWVLWVGIVLGVAGAADGLKTGIQAMQRLSKDRKEESPPPTSFNDHD